MTNCGQKEHETRPQGDLISRSALRKQFGYTDEWYKSRTVTQIIDNAPTVESDYEWGYSEGVHDTERPQGEWINQEQGAFYPIECSKCHNQPFYNDKGYVLSNFCPNCGADMQGEENDNS